MPNTQPLTNATPNYSAEIEITDEDVIDAMQHISGYLDISTEDFRDIYHLAHRHALGRIFKSFKAETLVRKVIEPLHSDMHLGEAAKIIICSGFKSLPVVDSKGCVVGMLTETDYLRKLKVDSFLELLLSMLDESFEFKHRCHETNVSEAMTSPAITINREADFPGVVSAFNKHDGRCTPVVDSEGHLLGVLLRKDLFASFNKGATK